MPFLEWLSQSALAAGLSGSATLYIFVNAAHILSIGLLVGAVIPLDLRLLGLFRNFPIAVLEPFLSRAAMTGACLAILTGFALFSVRPFEYAANPAFQTKLALIVIGIANAAFLHGGRTWRTTPVEARPASWTRLSAFVSLCVWTSAVLAGRWIGFL